MSQEWMEGTFQQFVESPFRQSSKSYFAKFQTLNKIDNMLYLL